MFRSCTYLTSATLNNWSVTASGSGYIDFDMFFSGCNKLETLSLSNWTFSKDIQCSSMFSGCSKLTTVDLSSWNVGIRNSSLMFDGCSLLTSINLSGFNFANCTNYTNMFRNVSTSCEIIVKDQANKDWFTNNFPSMTNVVIA